MVNFGKVPVGNLFAAILAWIFFGYEVGIVALIVALDIHINFGD